VLNVSFHVQQWDTWGKRWETIANWSDTDVSVAYNSAKYDLEGWQRDNPFGDFRMIKVTGTSKEDTVYEWEWMSDS